MRFSATFFKACRRQRTGAKMLNAKMGKRVLLFGLLVMGGISTREALAHAAVFLKCTYFNGAVGSIKIDPNAKKAFLNGGTLALEVSESFYTLTTGLDFGASGGGVVDIETKINRLSQQLTSRIVGGNKNGYFAQYPLGGMCSEDQPSPGTVF
jgi:hypothetical protein